MDNPLDSAPPLLSQLLWTSDPATRGAILVVLGAALLSILFVYAPLLVRLVRTALLERAVRAACRVDDRPGEAHREEMAIAFADSPLSGQWEEFIHRWKGTRTQGPPRERAPVRLLDVLEERPLLPTGARRSLLPALPGLFLAIGILGSFVGLTTAVSNGALAASELERSQLVGLLASQLGLALRTSLWGLILSVSAVVAGRLLEGSFERQAESLDRWVERAFGSISAGELAHNAAQAQRQTLEQLGAELTRFTNDLTERLDRGLQRIERSTASAANLVSEEQRGVLQSVVRELSVQVQQGVEQHLGALHDILDRSVEHQGAVTGGLAATFEQMADNAQVHARVTRVLERAATAVQNAAGSLSGTARDFTPVLEHLRETGSSLQRTSATMESTQHVVSRSADGVRISLEHAADALQEQRDFIESGLREIRSTLELMSTGLGENLSQALRGVDDALSQTVGRLRETISESNETIDRMALPVRAAEGTTREMQAALESVRSELVGLGDWLTQAIKPLRHTLTQLEDKTGDITHALIDFGDNTRSVDKTMDALRGEIHEEGRRFRSSTSELGRRMQQASETLLALERAAAGGVGPSGPVADLAATLEARPPPDSGPGTSPPQGLRPRPAKLETGPAPAPTAAPLPSGAAGQALGPDPYSRLETERAEREKAYLSTPSANPSDPRRSASDPPDDSDDLTLSGLLGRHATTPPAPPAPLGEDAELGSAPGSETGWPPESPAPAERDQPADEEHPIPRTWRFLGKD